MRRARIKKSSDEGAAVYHLISRTVGGEWLLGTASKEVLRRQLWQIADFAGLEIITYTILSNHFHILVRVPQSAPVTDEELLRRYGILYPEATPYRVARLDVIKSQLRVNGPEAVAWRKQMLALMNDISPYMKLLKERFTIWYNKKHNRFGTIWAERFKSTLVEPTGSAIAAVAAYIDLNCVRAGIVSDPKDYRYCCYAEAVSSNEKARCGIRSAIGGASWAEVQASYRISLFTTAALPRVNGAAIPTERVQRVIKQGGKLPLPEVLRCRIRYFSQSAVLGSKAFVEAELAVFRQRTKCGSRVKARPLPAITDWGDLAGLRPLRGALFG